MSASELLKAHEKDVKRKNSRSTSTSAPPVQNTAPDTPMLGRGLAPGSDLFFDESPNIKKRKSNDVERAKVRDVDSIFGSYQFKFFSLSMISFINTWFIAREILELCCHVGRSSILYIFCFMLIDYAWIA